MYASDMLLMSSVENLFVLTNEIVVASFDDGTCYTHAKGMTEISILMIQISQSNAGIVIVSICQTSPPSVLEIPASDVIC